MTQHADVSRSPSDRRVAHALANVEKAFARPMSLLACIRNLGEALMADRDQVSQSIADLKKAIQDDSASDQAVVNQLEQANADLQKKIDDLTAAGNATEAADLQTILDQINDAKSSIAGVTTGGSTPPGETNVPPGT
jgi:molecular chaperone GrpE (heat shock protein)